MSDEQRREYWAEVEVPYRPAYAYEEMLATIGDWPGSPTGLLPSYERIAARDHRGRGKCAAAEGGLAAPAHRVLFSRAQSANPLEVVLDFSPEDQLWAEWIAAVLASAEIPVRLAGEPSAFPDDASVETRIVAIVSESYISRMQDSPPAVPPEPAHLGDRHAPADADRRGAGNSSRRRSARGRRWTG